MPRRSGRLSGRELIHAEMSWTSGARAVVLQGHLAELRRQLACAGSEDRLGLPSEPVEPALRCRVALNGVLHPLRVTGHLGLEVLCPALIDDDCRGGHQHTARDPNSLCMVAETRRQTSTAVGDREQWQRRAGGVRNRDRDDPPADTICRCVRRQRCEHRPATWDEYEPEARAQEEASAEVTGAPTSGEAERSFYELAHLRHDQRQREREQQGRPDLDLVLCADADQAPQPGAGEQEGGERRDEAGGNRIRPPVSRSCATGEHDRQHREDARRERGDDARRERDRDEDEHSA